MRNTHASISKCFVTAGLVLVFAGVVTAQPFSHEPGAPLDLGSPYLPFGGDVNGDGLVDVVARTPGGSVSILLGQPDGTLAAPLSDTSGSGLATTLLADTNGDGRDDLWYIPTSGVLVYTQLAQADGTFGELVMSVLPLPMQGSLVADVDGDGRADLVAGENGGFRVQVMIAQGDGTLVLDQQLIAPDQPLDYALGDVDGDGTPDLVVFGSGLLESSLSVALGGPGGFAEPVTVATGVSGARIDTADLVGDDTADIVVQAQLFQPGSLVAYEGGPSLFDDPEPPVAFPGPVLDRWCFVDVDGNGLEDLVLSRLDDEGVDVRLQTADTVFAAAVTMGTPEGAAFTGIVEDLDLDGTVDLVVYHDDHVLVESGHGDGTFGRGVPAWTGPKPVVVDLDGDGLPDVISRRLLPDDTNRIEVRQGRFGGSLAPPDVLPVTAPVIALAADDIDGDAAPDLVAVLDSGLTTDVLVWFNDGLGNLSVPVQTTWTARTDVAVVGDVTGDGNVDVALLGISIDPVHLLAGNGDGTFVETLLEAPGVNVVSAAIGDVDGDQVDDVLAVGKLIGPKRLLAYTATGLVELGVLQVTSLPRVMRAGDLNGQGKLTIVVAGGETGFEVWRKNAQGEWTVAFFVDTLLYPNDLALHDVDGDGDADVVAGESSVFGPQGGRVSTWIDDGNALLPGSVLDLPDGLYHVTLADLDGDGLLDTLASSFEEARVLLNADATWAPLGHSLAGSAGYSRLDGFGPFTSGGSISLEIRDAVPLASTMLVVGLSELVAPFKGGVLVPAPDIVIAGLSTDLEGGIALPATLPGGIPAGLALFFQAWQVDGGGFAATTALLGTAY